MPIESPSKLFRIVQMATVHLTRTRYFPKDVLSGFPEQVIAPLSNKAKSQLAATVACLNFLYGRVQNSWYNLTEESFFFTDYGRELLSKGLAWIQGSIIIVDKDSNSIEMPAIDSPANAVALPFLTATESHLLELRRQLGFKKFRQHLTIVVDHLPGLSHMRDSLETLEAFLFAGHKWYELTPEVRSTITDQLIAPCEADANEIFWSFRRRGPGNVDNDIVLQMSRIIRQLLLTSFLKQSRQKHKEAYYSFMDAMMPSEVSPTSSEALTSKEREHGFLFVEDPEITLLLLSRELSNSFPRDAGCLDRQELYASSLRLGLLERKEDARIEITARTIRVCRWLSFLLDPKFDPQEDEFTMSHRTEHLQKRWRWVRELGARDGRILAVSRQLLNTPKNIDFYFSLCDALFLDNNVLRLSSLSPPVILEAQQLLDIGSGVDERNYALFPLTTMLSSNERGTRKSAFVGVLFGKVPVSPQLDNTGKYEEPMTRADQIRRTCVFTALITRPTIMSVQEDAYRRIRLREEKERTDKRWQEISFIIGHDLKNRLDELDCSGAIRSLQKLKKAIDSLTVHDVFNLIRRLRSRELRTQDGKPTNLQDHLLEEFGVDTKLLEAAEYCLAGVDSIYATSELYRVSKKYIETSSNHEMPAEWLRRNISWPSDFRSSKHIPMIADGMRGIIHSIVFSPGFRSVRAASKFELRKIFPGEPPRTITDDGISTYKDFVIVPFAGRPQAGSEAIMSGLKEIVRNALRSCLLDDDKRRWIKNDYGKLHIDYSITYDEIEVTVKIWNPYAGNVPTGVDSIHKMQTMYAPLDGAIEVSEPRKDETYPFGIGVKAYALSVFRYRPALLAFEQPE